MKRKSKLQVEGFVKDDILYYTDLDGVRQHGLIYVCLTPCDEQGKKEKELAVRFLSRKAWVELSYLLTSLKKHNIQAHKF